MADDINIDIGARNKTQAGFRSALQDARKLGQQVGRAAQQAGRSMANVGKKMVAVGAAGGIAMGFAVKGFAAFDDEMAKMAALTGESGSALDQLRAKAAELGSTTAFTATQAAEGMNFLAKAGFDAQQIIAGIGPTLALAAAGGLELGEAADIASDVGTMFGFTAEEIGRVSDVLAQTATNANTDIRMMGESFKYAGATASIAGQSLEETSAAIALLAKRGVKASVAGTSLNQLFTALVQKSEAFAEQGVKIEDEFGNIRPVLDIMQDLRTELADLTQAERVKWFTDLGVRSGRAGAILASVTNVEVENFRDLLNDADGAATRMAETMLTGLGGAGKKLMSAFEGMRNAFVESFKEPLIAAAEALAGFFQSMTKVFQANQNLAKGLAVATFAIAALGSAAVTAGVAVIALGLAIAGTATVAGGIGTAFAAAFTPAGLAVGGVLLLVGMLTASLVESMRRTGAYKDAWNALTSTLSQLMDVLGQVTAGITDALGSGEYALAAKMAWAGVKLAVAIGLEGILDATIQILPKIIDVFFEVFSEVASVVFKAMQLVYDITRGGGVFSAVDLATALADMGNPFEAGQNFATQLREGAQQELDQLKMEAAIANMSKRFEEMGKGAADAMADGIQDNADTIQNAIVGAVGPDDDEHYKRMFRELFPRIREGLDFGLKEHLMRVGVETINEKQKPAFRAAGGLQATTGRLLSGGRSPMDAVEEQLRIQNKETKKGNEALLKIEENTQLDRAQGDKILLDFNMGIV